MGVVLSPFGAVSVKTTPYTYVTSGTVPLPNTGGNWAVLLEHDGVTPFELDIAAVVGNRIAVVYTGVRTGNNPVDAGVVVGTTIKRFMATGTATPASDGDPGWYGAGALLPSSSGMRSFVVTAGDLDGANVRVCVVSNGNASSGTLIATASDPFSWQLFNFGSA